MAVIDRRGKPLPEGHPLKNGPLVIFGRKPNVPSGAPKGKDSLSTTQAARVGEEEAQALAKHRDAQILSKDPDKT